MPWFKVDDKLHSHVKAARAGLEAMGLWTIAGSWSMDQLTDGFVPDYIAARLHPKAKRLAAALVKAGLWDEAEKDGDTGWQFHDWDEYQPTRDETEAKREYERDKKRAQRAKGQASTSRGDNGRFTSVSPRDNHGDSPRDSRGESPATRPDPTRPKSATHSSAADAARFGEFWLLYPKKVAKGQAEKAWKAAVKKTDAGTILGALRSQLPDMAMHLRVDGDFRPNPATWLNGERWADERPPASKAARGIPEGW